MSGQRWKRAEREIAAVLGGDRLPNNGAGQPDVITDRHAIQVKTRLSLPEWLIAAVDQSIADAGDRIPLVVLNEVSQRRKARRLVVIDLDHWRELQEVSPDDTK